MVVNILKFSYLCNKVFPAIPSMNIVRIILLATYLSIFGVTCNAQLRKSVTVEKVKTFTNGSVRLNKSIIEEDEVYSVTLKNNSRYFEPIVLFLGTKDEMLTNLKDLSAALEEGKKGEIFDFQSCGQNYQLTFHKVLGQRCFKVWEEHNVQSDFGNFYKSTIDDIIEYFNKKE